MLWTISHYTIEFMRQLLMLDLKPADLPATNLLSESRKEVFDWMAVLLLHFWLQVVTFWRIWFKSSFEDHEKHLNPKGFNYSNVLLEISVVLTEGFKSMKCMTMMNKQRLHDSEPREQLLIAWSTKGKSLEKMKIHDDAMLFEIASNNLRC